MKIGLVLSRTPNYSETFFNSKIKGLIQSGYEVTLFAQFHDPSFNLCKVVLAPKVYKDNAVLQVFAMLWGYAKLVCRCPKRLWKLMVLERKEKRGGLQIAKNMYNNAHMLTADLDWLHFGFATMAIQSEVVAEAIGAKMAVSLRGYDMDIYPKKHRGCYGLLWHKVDKVHAISKYMETRAKEEGLGERVPVQIITPALDVQRFSNLPQNLRKEGMFLTIGRLHEIKGIDLILKALKELKEQGETFTYRVIGEGKEREVLERLIVDLGLEDQVVLEGKQTHEMIVDHLRNTDIYIQYSLSEGFCNAVLEAQAMGCLCVVSNGGALPENVLDGETGWVVSKNNPKALAGKISEISQLTEEAKAKIREAAQKRVYNEFNLESQRKQFQAFYTN
ncbi:hypothetical protein BKM32_08920 [Mangrovimonas sp. DI 80]|nr:hypothetical protein BKM32_08920 [Mangrovimonas sp. DI 80]